MWPAPESLGFVYVAKLVVVCHHIMKQVYLHVTVTILYKCQKSNPDGSEQICCNLLHECPIIRVSKQGKQHKYKVQTLWVSLIIRSGLCFKLYLYVIYVVRAVGL